MSEFVFDDFVIINIPCFDSLVEEVNTCDILLIDALNIFLAAAKNINDLTCVEKIKVCENFQVSTRKHIIQLLKLDDCDIDFIKINKRFSIVNCLDENEVRFKLFEVVRVFRAYGFNFREISEKIEEMVNCVLYDSNLSTWYYDYLRNNKYID